MLQRHAFEAWAEIDIQLIPATLPTLDQESNGPTTRQPSPSNKKKDPASVHNQIKMKPPPAETLVVYPDGSYHRADQRRTGCGLVIVSGGDGDDDLHASEVARGWKPLPKGSNNTAELFADIEALKWILKFDRHRKRPISSSALTRHTPKGPLWDTSLQKKTSARPTPTPTLDQGTQGKGWPSLGPPRRRPLWP